MDNEKVRRQFGLWDSPITPARLSRSMGFPDVAWDEDGALVWLETRSDRFVLVLQPADGQAARDLNSDFSARGRVGYGGGDFTVGKGHAYFAEAGSGRIYRQPLQHGLAKPVTPAFGEAAGAKLSPDGRWLLFVRSYEGQDTLEIVDAEGKFWPQKLVSGEDFYMQPAWSPAGDRIAWVCWNFPNMPWDGTYLRMATLRSNPGSLPVLEGPVTVAGDENTSIFQPEFSPDGRYLAYVSDLSGWWQIYLYDLQSGAHRQLTSQPAEHAGPAWIQGLRTYGFGPDGKSLFFIRNQNGFSSLWQLDLERMAEHAIPLGEEYTTLDQISVSAHGIALVASGGRQPARVITTRLPAGEPDKAEPAVHVWRRGTSEEAPPSGYSQPEATDWLGMDGETAYGMFYPPHSEVFEGIGKPPLIVNIHGGPTSQVRDSFNSRAQFFTSRGYAVLEVNYRGSTGYGRKYRDKLRGSWGIYDVEDAVSGAKSLAGRDLVDPGRMVIMGGSAGGYTVLLALENYPGFFKAGICLYGVADLFNAETHKFEQHYNDMLVGSLPEAADVYRQRSPAYYVDKIQDPIALFQGEDDRVVPRKHMDDVVAVLQQRGVPHIYHVYPGEGHGFRKIETLEHFYKTVERFLWDHVIYA
jgi:dipeptidyl aminopeptidase/acylaminoacyl peptidase